MTSYKHNEFKELIPGLPEDVTLECLSRLHYTAHQAVIGVCHRWEQIIKSKEFYLERKRNGRTRMVACLVQAMVEAEEEEGKMAKRLPAFGLSLFDLESRSWERLEPPPGFHGKVPLFCEVTSSNGELILIGGCDPTTYAPLTTIFIHDFTTRQWRVGKPMPSARSLFAIASIDNHVLVAGGHDPDKNALNTAMLYNVDTDTWFELPAMNEHRDECQGVVIGPKFWVISGYETGQQGEFKSSAEVYDTGSGRWRRVDGVWGACEGPRGRVGVRDWAAGPGEVGRAVRWAVGLGDWALVGLEDEGGSRAFWLVESVTKGRHAASRELTVPSEFAGFVQSGCCLEI